MTSSPSPDRGVTDQATSAAEDAIRRVALEIGEGECAHDERECFMRRPIHVATMTSGHIESVAIWEDDPIQPGVVILSVEALARAVAAAGLLAHPDDGRLPDLADAVAEAYTAEGVSIWWTEWARAYPAKRSRMETGVLVEWSGEARVQVDTETTPDDGLRDALRAARDAIEDRRRAAIAAESYVGEMAYRDAIRYIDIALLTEDGTR